MTKLFRFLASFAVFFAIFGVVFVSSAGVATAASTQGYTFRVAYNSTVGNYLVTSQGYTLYNNGNSACTGGCASIWVPYYNASAISVPQSLNSSEFGIINLTNGGKQFTYLGKALYTYYQDTAPGQMNGNGVFNIWYVVKVPNYTGTSTNASTAAKNIVTNSTASNASKRTTVSSASNTTAKTSNSTLGRVGNTSKNSSSSSVPTLGSSNYSSLPSTGKQGNSNAGLYIAVIVIIIIIAILAYIYMRKK
jgi:predicted lipoprotein with Yx(FWY)xxD motif